MKTPLLLLLTALVALPACRFFDPQHGGTREEVITFSDDTLVADTSQATFARLYAHWTRTRPATYRFTYQASCFCAERGPFTVQVQGENVTSVRPPSAPDYRRVTLDSLYATVADAFARNAASVQYRYDPDSKLMADFFIDYDARMADEEFGAGISRIVLPR